MFVLNHNLEFQQTTVFDPLLICSPNNILFTLVAQWHLFAVFEREAAIAERVEQLDDLSAVVATRFDQHRRAETLHD